MSTIRILIAEDVDLVAAAFEALLSTVPDFEVVGRVGRGDHVKEAVERLRPDVALLDVDMPGMTGIEATRELTGCRVLLLTALEGPGHLQQAISAGAHGYILKSTSGQGLIDAVRTVADGGMEIDPAMAATALRQGPNPLSTREQEILLAVGRGLGTKEIAAELFLSSGTVRNYISNAMVKLDVTTRADAVQAATRNGWL